jgi:hypothetical protein
MLVRPNQNDILVSARRCYKLPFLFTLAALKGNKKICVDALAARTPTMMKRKVMKRALKKA